MMMPSPSRLARFVVPVFFVCCVPCAWAQIAGENNRKADSRSPFVHRININDERGLAITPTETLRAYSPIHNVKTGAKYPPTLITTADHDDRVVPAHSFKFAAAMQKAQAGEAPVLIRIDTKAGHGAGKPTSKLIDEAADTWAFLIKALDAEQKMAAPATTTATK